MRNPLGALVLLTASMPAVADWVLDNDASTVSFLSVKAATVAEVHSFDELAGRIDETGVATLVIDLDSVNTAIDIRDERMREMLFNTDEFAVATVTLDIEAGLLENLEVGQRISTAVEAELRLHGQAQGVTAEVTVARLADDRLLVTSEKPVVLDAAAFGLADGIEKLRAVAGLSGITPAVPVTFVLTFEPGL